jgi:hypothetical protein
MIRSSKFSNVLARTKATYKYPDCGMSASLYSSVGETPTTCLRESAPRRESNTKGFITKVVSTTKCRYVNEVVEDSKADS